MVDSSHSPGEVMDAQGATRVDCAAIFGADTRVKRVSKRYGGQAVRRKSGERRTALRIR